MSSSKENALLELARTLKKEGYRFTTVTPATHARVNSRPGNAWAAGVRDVFGWSRPFREGAVSPDLMQRMRAAGIIEPYADGWRSLVRLSSLQGDLFVHSAYPTVESDAVFFGPDTYRFISSLMQLLGSRPGAVRRAADIGCGAGPGAIVLARAYPEAEVFAADINESALRLTGINAALAGTPNVTPRVSNLLSGLDGEFDIIIANPPYLLDAGERTYRHGGGDYGEGLALDIVRAARTRLAAGGTLFLYTGTAVVDGVDCFQSRLAEITGRDGFEWRYRELDPDVFGEELSEPAYDRIDRIAAVALTMTRLP